MKYRENPSKKAGKLIFCKKCTILSFFSRFYSKKLDFSRISVGFCLKKVSISLLVGFLEFSLHFDQKNAKFLNVKKVIKKDGGKVQTIDKKMLT